MSNEMSNDAGGSKPMKTLVGILLDESGSMAGQQKSVVDGVNLFLEDQKKEPGFVAVAVAKFSGMAGFNLIRLPTDLNYINSLQETEYRPNGGTPLYDAVGNMITLLQQTADQMLNRPDKICVVVATDGVENESKEFDHAKLTELIKQKEDTGEWMFIYMGAGIKDFKGEAAAMGTSFLSNSVGYDNTYHGTVVAYGATSDAVKMMRSTGATVSSELGRKVDEEVDGEWLKSKLANLKQPI